MLTAEKLREVLKKEYGIKNDKELNKELNRKGDVKIGIFTEDYYKGSKDYEEIA